MTATILTAIFTVSRSIDLAILSKATLLLCLGLAAAYLVKRGSASVRHVLLSATFCALLVLPFVAIWAPPVAVGIGEVAQPGSPATSGPTGTTIGSKPVQGALRESVPQAPAFTKLPSAITIFRTVWLAGAFFLGASLLVDFWRLRRLHRTSIPATDLKRRMQAYVPSRIELLLHEEVSAPMTYGFTNPAILLPHDAAEWTDEDLRRCLIHELEHVRRSDWAVQIMARAVCVLYWVHPLAWMAWRRLSLEAERACDDAVVRQEEGSSYAEQLVTLATRLSSRPSALPVLGMAHRSDLSARVHSILNSDQPRGRAGFTVGMLTLAGALGMAVALAPVQAVAQTSITKQVRSLLARTPHDAELFEAAERNNVQRVEELIAAGANVNAVLDGDGSPLIAAARKGHDHMVRILLDRGADRDMGVAGDGSPLIMAARNGHLSTVQLLLSRGADIHKAVEGDGNPLIMASRGGSVEVVQYLLDHGASIEQVVPGDENALIEASASGRLPVVKLLVARGANVNARVWSERGAGTDGEWRTPLNMATRRKHPEVVAFLQSAGATQ